MWSRLCHCMQVVQERCRIIIVAFSSFVPLGSQELYFRDALLDINQVHLGIVHTGIASLKTRSRMYQNKPLSLTTSTLRPNKASNSVSNSTPPHDDIRSSSQVTRISTSLSQL